MTLEEMFVDIKYRHDGRGARDAKRGVLDIKGAVDELKAALDQVNRALNVLSGAAVVTATAGTVAYSNWTRTVAELAGKAGLATREFRKLYTAESGAITRMVGGDRRLALESMQRAHSLGANVRQGRYLARLGSILQSGRQAHSSTAVEAAMSLQAGGFGEAGDNLQRVYAAAQSGAGNVEDYFAAARRAGGIASAAGVGLNDMLAMLTIGSQGGSMGEATTRTMAVIRAMARTAPKQAQDFFRERTGQEWSFLSDMQRNEGTLAAIDFISKNFKDSELFKLFTEVEAVNLVKPLMQSLDTARANRARIEGAPEARYIEAFGEDIGKEFYNAVERFRNTISDFLKAFGRPFATLIKPLLNLFTRMVDMFLRLNDATGGLLAWIPALLSTLLVLRKLIFTAFLGQVAAKLFERMGNLITSIGRSFGDSRPGQAAKNRAEGVRDFGRGFGAGFAGGAVGAGLANAGGFFKYIAGGVRTILAGKHGVGGIIGIMSKYSGVAVKTAGTLALLAIGVKMLVGVLGRIALFLAPFVLWSKFRSPDSFDPSQRFSGPQTQYFAEGKPRGGEPAPGWRDIRAHNRMVAEAEAALLWNAIKQTLSDLFTAIDVAFRANAPNFVVWAWDQYIGAITKFFQILDEIAIGVGEFVRELLANPGNAAGGAWDWYWGKQAERFSSAAGAILGLFGKKPEEADALAELTDQTESGRVVTPVLQITPDMAKALGIEGDYTGVTGSDNVKSIILPTPPSPLTSSAINNAPQLNYTTGDIIISVPEGGGGSADDQAREYQRVIREELKHQADYIIQEMDWASP